MGTALDLGERMGTLSVDCTSRRLAKALVSLGERMGHQDPQNAEAWHMAPLSHKLLAQYIGTTREAVTHCMNQFRRQGFLSYSRRGMTIFADNVRQWLQSTVRQSKKQEEPEMDRHEMEHAPA